MAKPELMSDSSSSKDSHEAFVELFTGHEQALRAFVRTLVPTWHDADEIVQEVALTAWRKFDEFEQGTSFISWVCMIARFKTLSYRRKMARDRLSFSGELMELMADEGIEEDDKRKREYQALESCLSQLPEKQKRWVMLAYTPGFSVKAEAERSGVRPDTFYMRTNRIRKILFECIQKTLKSS